VALSIRNVKYS